MIYDVTDAARSGRPLPFSGGCVWTFRTDGGTAVIQFSPGMTPQAAAEALKILAESARPMSLPKGPSGCPADETLPHVPASPRGTLPDETAPPPPEEASRANEVPEAFKEDLVPLGGGYDAYRSGGRWHWVRWRSDTGPLWGRSGPLAVAAAEQKGPFDNFDETLASALFSRSRSESLQEGPSVRKDPLP